MLCEDRWLNYAQWLDAVCYAGVIMMKLSVVTGSNGTPPTVTIGDAIFTTVNDLDVFIGQHLEYRWRAITRPGDAVFAAVQSYLAEDLLKDRLALRNLFVRHGVVGRAACKEALGECVLAEMGQINITTLFHRLGYVGTSAVCVCACVLIFLRRLCM